MTREHSNGTTATIKPVYTPAEWAKLSGLHVNTVYALLQAGRYGDPDKLKHGHRYLIPADALGFKVEVQG